MRPPPGIVFTCCFGAGLATGLLRFGAPAGAIALLAGGVLATWHRPRLGPWALAVLLGRLLGDVTTWEAGWSCTTRLPAGRIAVRIRLAEPADADGGRLEAWPVDAGCRGRVVVRWPRGIPAPAGTEVMARARWIPPEPGSVRPGGTLVVREATLLPSWPRVHERLRTGIAHATARLYGPRAPIVDALILGRRADMKPELRDAFAGSGLVHLLSISGFHVGLVCAWVVLIARLLGARRMVALVAGAGLGTAYVAFIGWPAPAARAAALAAMLAYSVARQRRVQADALLAATCLLVLVVDPWAVLELGGWLSAAALWGATTFTRWSDLRLGRHAGWRTFAASVGATLATAPLTAAALGTVALVGIGLNFVAIPLAAVAVPGTLASVLLLPVSPWLAERLAAGSGLALGFMEQVARFGAAVPGGHLVTIQEPRAALPWVALLAMALWGIGRRNTLAEAARRWSWAGVAAVWAALVASWPDVAGDSDSRLALHFLDVGQGDAALIRTPHGRWVLIDAGPRSERFDAGRRQVVPFLQRHRAGGIAIAVVSHAHADHLGGMPAVLDRYAAELIIEPAAFTDEPLYVGWLALIAAEGLTWHAGRPGDHFAVDGVDLAILHPRPGWAHWGEDLNEDSVVLLIRYGEFQALFTGDAGWEAEASLAGAVGKVDLLKVGHHGSRTATSDPWLDELAPCAAVISVGARNDYGHPAPATLGRLAQHRVPVWRTDRDGDITVLTDGQTMTVRGERGSLIYTTSTRPPCSPTHG